MTVNLKPKPNQKADSDYYELLEDARILLENMERDFHGLTAIIIKKDAQIERFNAQIEKAWKAIANNEYEAAKEILEE